MKRVVNYQIQCYKRGCASFEVFEEAPGRYYVLVSATEEFKFSKKRWEEVAEWSRPLAGVITCYERFYNIAALGMPDGGDPTGKLLNTPPFVIERRAIPDFAGAHMLVDGVTLPKYEDHS